MTNWQAFRSLPWRSKLSLILAVFPLLYSLIVVKGLKR